MDIRATARSERTVAQQSTDSDKTSLLAISNISQRPAARGKFIFIGEQKLWIKGVSYGSFLGHSGAEAFPAPEVVEKDFAAMARCGINTVRIYTVPPRWLLDRAQSQGLRVMVGLPWEQHVAFLDDPQCIRTIEHGVVTGVRACAGHPAVLCYALGNEIPASIVRWHGARHIEAFIERLYYSAKKEDPSALYTYVNYPTTEYLRLPFLDFVSFNVYLESVPRLEAYLARLQNLSGERPLLLAEIGLDSQRHGETLQARGLAAQIEIAFKAACAGVFVFAWTDEWYRGGYRIEDWKFGMTGRDRSPKPAYSTVRKAYAGVPFPGDWKWPRVSVVVCSYDGARTIRDTLEGLLRLDYPRYEVILVDDGSTDATPAIASEYDIRLIRTKNRGLSAARNSGWQTASGEIVAYIDDDAYPDPHWLTFLTAALISGDHVGVGGPNLAPAGDGFVADCVANAPGGPAHVLISDREAEHIPGCNMAFRRAALEEVGGFDPRFRSAGDDVDLCWRLQQLGGRLAFHAGAVVWHHRRDSVATYWRQQLGYGRAEALLEEKWPEKYNVLGHLSWSGRLYGRGLTRPLRIARGRLYQGVWGSAAFQSLYEPGKTALGAIPLMPEWYLLVALLGLLSLSGILWTPMLYALPVLGVAIAVAVIQAAMSAAKAEIPIGIHSFRERVEFRYMTAFLHLLQPLARLLGRVRHGLTPWRRRGDVKLVLPGWKSSSVWSEHWQSSEKRLCDLEAMAHDRGVVVTRGSAYERMDLAIRGGVFGRVCMLLAVEEHGAGKQLIRVRQWPACSRIGGLLLLILGALAIGTFLDRAGMACLMFVLLGFSLTARMALDCAYAAGAFAEALERVEGKWVGDD